MEKGKVFYLYNEKVDKCRSSINDKAGENLLSFAFPVFIWYVDMVSIKIGRSIASTYINIHR